jgi:hypothetical protein
VNGYRGAVTEPRRAALRVLRACALSAAAVASALAVHRLNGGATPAAATTVQAVLVLTVVMGLLARRRRSVTTLLLGLGGTQLLLHQWFSLATPGECASHLAAQYVPGAHLLPQPAMPWGLLAQTARACATTGDTGATVVAAAVAGHGLAAMVTGLLLTRGEALLAAAARVVLPRLPGRPAVRLGLRRVVEQGVVRLSDVGTRGHVRRRGPPVPLSAA